MDLPDNMYDYRYEEERKTVIGNCCFCSDVIYYDDEYGGEEPDDLYHVECYEENLLNE